MTTLRPGRGRRRGGTPGFAVAAVLIPLSLHAQAPDVSEVVDSAVVDAVVTDVCDRRIVMLGELPSHGEAVAFAIKASIARRLVENCGFDAILFEAPFYEFFGLRTALADRRADASQLDRALGGFWFTRGLRPWRRWLFEMATDGRVFIGGLDDQVSATSDYARATLASVVERYVPADRSTACASAIDRNLNWLYDDEQPFDAAERGRLHECARLAAAAASSEDGTGKPGDATLLANLASLYERQHTSGTPARDGVMASNFFRLAARRPNDSRYIVWTATVHAARQQSGLPHRPLGAWLADEYGDALATLGFTAFSGESSMAGMPIRELGVAPAGSLEERAVAGAADDDEAIYLDLEMLRTAGPIASRLFGSFSAADWSQAFDGVVVIREEAAPVFEPR